MNGVLTMLFLAVFLFFIGRVEVRPRRMNSEDPAWTRFDEVPSAETFGYIAMFAGGLCFAVTVATADAVWVAGADSSPVGAFLVFCGAAWMWCRYYDRLFHRLRRSRSTPRWAQLVGRVGRHGYTAGPAVLTVGVLVSVFL